MPNRYSTILQCVASLTGFITASWVEFIMYRKWQMSVSISLILIEFTSTVLI